MTSNYRFKQHLFCNSRYETPKVQFMHPESPKVISFLYQSEGDLTLIDLRLEHQASSIQDYYKTYFQGLILLMLLQLLVQQISYLERLTV